MIYLDNNATTRLNPRVLDAMMPFLTDTYANAASTHPFGVSAHEAVKRHGSRYPIYYVAKPTNW